MTIRVFQQDGKRVIHKQTDPTPGLQKAALLREKNETPFAADWWHVGSIDAHTLELWAKEAGVKFSDQKALREVVKKKLMDSDFAAFRVKGGSY